MIGFEGKLPLLAATFKRLIPDTMVTAERPVPVPRPKPAPSGSAHFDGRSEAEETTILVQGLTWADTVDLTYTAERQ